MKVFNRLEDQIHAITCHIKSGERNQTSHKKNSVVRLDPNPTYMHHELPNPRIRLPIALCHTLQLVLLLDGVRVAASLGGVDKLFSQALSNALDVAERGLAGTDGEEGNGLVHAAERRHIDGLATDGTGGTDTGGVFAGTAVDNGVNGNLDGVLVGHDVDLKSSARVLQDFQEFLLRNLEAIIV